MITIAQVPVRAGFYGAKDNKPPSRPGSSPNWLDEVLPAYGRSQVLLIGSLTDA